MPSTRHPEENHLGPTASAFAIEEVDDRERNVESCGLHLMRSLAGLTAGLATKVDLALPRGQLMFALALAAVLAVWSHSRALIGISRLVRPAQTVAGAFVGALALLHSLTTFGTPSADNWQQIGARVVGS